MSSISRHSLCSDLPQGEGWLTEGLLDAEYKEYILLAWIQRIRAELKQTKLYPSLAEVIRRHRELMKIKSSMDESRDKGDVTGIDLHSLQVMRQRLHPSSLEEYLRELIERSLPHLSQAMEEGRTLYDLIDRRMEFQPIGVQPLHMGEGYLLVTHGSEAQRRLMAFRYTKSRIERGGDAFLELTLECMESRALNRTESLDDVKWGLIRRHRDLPQPATFHAHMDWMIPLEPTLLPIARRRLLREIAEC